jgi:hypothetical protein
VICWRLLPWREGALPTEPGGALWFPRELQGAGRHDNPDRYGCLYVSESPVSAVVEAFAPFRGTGVLSAAMLVRGGLRLALAQLQLDDHSDVLDLDDPRVLEKMQLRPSRVATGARAVTQAYALQLFDEYPSVVGLRWWSTLEASLLNLTLYDRAAESLAFREMDLLALSHPAVLEAAELLGLDLSG